MEGLRLREGKKDRQIREGDRKDRSGTRGMWTGTIADRERVAFGSLYYCRVWSEKEAGAARLQESFYLISSQGAQIPTQREKKKAIAAYSQAL